MRHPAIETLLSAAGQPVAGHTLSAEELAQAGREGRVVEIFSSPAGKGEVTVEHASTVVLDDDGRVRGTYLVFPRTVPRELRRPGAVDRETVDQVYAEFAIGGSEAGASFGAVGPVAREAPPHHRCSICSQLAAYECGFQNAAAEEDDTFLPAAADNLELARDLRPGRGSRQQLLKRCPECGTWYLYETDYEFLMFGTEDEQRLTRLTRKQADEYLGLAQPEKGWWARMVEKIVSPDRNTADPPIPPQPHPTEKEQNYRPPAG